MYTYCLDIEMIRMWTMKLTTILSILPFYHVATDIEHIEINSLQMDSRQVTDGDLFICIRGFTVDGHDFIDQAIENGARAIVAEQDMQRSVPTIVVPDTSRALAMLSAKFYQFPTEDLHMIGITGTNGKTTITYILETIFKHYKQKTGLIGTIQMKIGDESIPIVNTTPDALRLQRSFHQMVDQHVDVAMMEVSSHALDLGRVFGCNFDIAVFTNLSQDHLDYHKDMEDYLRAKSLLFSQLGNAYPGGKTKYAIINADDPASHYLKKSTSQTIITYGCEKTAQVNASQIELSALYTAFKLNTPLGSVHINSQLIGMFNVYNMLAATSAALASNVPLDVIKEALENIPGVSGRFEQVKEGQNYSVIVDYAHTPDSLENVLQTIKDFAKRNIYVVVGCGGDRDRGKRPLMANVAVKYADHSFFTSDNPRTEDPEEIIKDMTRHLSKTNYEEIVSRRQAIYKAVELAETDDIILIAGKGHETEQQIGDEIFEFDDREVAREAIRAKEK